MRPNEALVQSPVDLSRARSRICGADVVAPASSRLVLTAAKTRPDGSACSDLRLMWSSALFGPWIAVRLACHVVGVAPSSWIAKYIAEATWLLHITPILLSNATTAEMSSASS